MSQATVAYAYSKDANVFLPDDSQAMCVSFGKQTAKKGSVSKTSPSNIRNNLYFARLVYEFNRRHPYVNVDKIFSRIRREANAVRRFISSRPLLEFSESDEQTLVFERLERRFRKEILYEVGKQIAQEEVSRFAHKHINVDKADLLQIALEALLRANIDVRFDNNRIYKFLHIRIGGALLDYYRKEKGSRCKVPNPVTIPFSIISDAIEGGMDKRVVHSADLFEAESEQKYESERESSEISESYKQALDFYEGAERLFLEEYFGLVLTGSGTITSRDRQKIGKKNNLSDEQIESLLLEFQKLFSEIHYGS